MDNFIASAEALFKWLMPLGWVLATAALGIAGLMLTVGDEESKAKAKKRFPAIAIGAFIFAGSVTLGKELVALAAF